jgi:hypothetical protein
VNTTIKDEFGNIFLDGDMTFTQKKKDSFTQQDIDEWLTGYTRYLNLSSTTRDVFAPGISTAAVKQKIDDIYPKDKCCDKHFYQEERQACCGAVATAA